MTGERVGKRVHNVMFRGLRKTKKTKITGFLTSLAFRRMILPRARRGLTMENTMKTVETLARNP